MSDRVLLAVRTNSKLSVHIDLEARVSTGAAFTRAANGKVSDSDDDSEFVVPASSQHDAQAALTPFAKAVRKHREMMKKGVAATMTSCVNAATAVSL